MSTKEKEPTKPAVPDLDTREHFNSEGELTDADQIKIQAEERERLLGTPVGSTPQGYSDDPPPSEKAGADESVDFREGETGDTLAARYSKKQLGEYLDANEVEYKKTDTLGALGAAVWKHRQGVLDAEKQTALNTLPAAPEINAPEGDAQG